MEYHTSIELDLPRDRVIELFDDPANLPKWQKGLQSFEPVSGTPGQEGAKSRLVFDMRGSKMEMIETITRRDLPEAFDGTYEARGVFNRVENRFTELPGGRTLWESYNVFEFAGFMKLIGWLMPGSFRRQSLKYMEDFKAFVERGVDVRNAD